MQFTRRTLLQVLGATPLSLGLGTQISSVRAAEGYPLNKLTIVVPFNPGGSADRMARAIGKFLPLELGDTPVSVVNRAGGSGALGHSWFSRQKDDGSYALVSPVNPYLISNILRGQGDLKWDDFYFVNGQWQDYYVVLVNKEQPYKTMADLVADIRDKPGTVSCAIIPGDGGHLSAVVMLEKLGIPRENVNWITYDGGGPMRTALAGNQVTMSFISALGSNVIADQVRPLAVYRDERDDARWDAPTINEALAPMSVEVPVIAADLRTFTVHKSFKEKHPDRYELLVAAYRRMLDRPDFKAFIEEGQIGGDWLGPEKTAKSLEKSYKIFEQYISIL